MKKSILTLVFVLASTSAFADQAAGMKCVSKNVVLTAKTPYLGESSNMEQTLYTLKSVNSQDESAYTAYFLNTKSATKNTLNYTIGKNGAGGSFTLTLKPWVDVGDGTVADLKTTGVITYNHGPLAGKNEAVQCELN